MIEFKLHAPLNVNVAEHPHNHGMVVCTVKGLFRSRDYFAQLEPCAGIIIVLFKGGKNMAYYIALNIIYIFLDDRSLNCV